MKVSSQSTLHSTWYALASVFVATFLAFSSTAQGKEESVSLNGATLTVKGIPDTWNQSKSQKGDGSFIAKALGSSRLTGLPYIEMILTEKPQPLEMEAFLEQKSILVKKSCVSGFKANHLTQDFLSSTGADLAGLIKCESRDTAPDSPYTEVYLVKEISGNQVGLISLSLSQKGFTLTQMELEMVNIVKSLSVSATKNK